MKTKKKSMSKGAWCDILRCDHLTERDYWYDRSALNEKGSKYQICRMCFDELKHEVQKTVSRCLRAFRLTHDLIQLICDMLEINHMEPILFGRCYGIPIMSLPELQITNQNVKGVVLRYSHPLSLSILENICLQTFPQLEYLELYKDGVLPDCASLLFISFCALVKTTQIQRVFSDMNFSGEDFESLFSCMPEHSFYEFSSESTPKMVVSNGTKTICTVSKSRRFGF